MTALLSGHINDLSKVNKKEPGKESENEFINSLSSMSTLLSNHIGNLSEINKKEPGNKFIDDMRSMLSSLHSLIDNVSEINKKISLIEKLPCTYTLCNKDLNKFELLLQKGVYPYEYMDSWERFNETSLLDKKSFYSELNKEDITDEEYAYAQKVWEVFKINNLGEYHNLYVQIDTLLLSDVSENLR